MKNLHDDIMGLACADYLAGQRNAKIKVVSNIVEDDYIPASYLFRDYAQMPAIEQTALKLCKGQTLDVGAGAGSHALWLQLNDVGVTALEVSPGLCAVMRQRGVSHVVNDDFFQYQPNQLFDTVLMMMNGIGIAGNLEGVSRLLAKSKRLLAPEGQLLVDSCDIAYLFDDPQTEHLPETLDHYYGEIRYQMCYKQYRGKRFGWLFVDAKMLSAQANMHGLKCDVLEEGTNGEFLAKLY
ncbi:MAG: class I SAM-dependent methyltransferase [Breznakibacter sp.]